MYGAGTIHAAAPSIAVGVLCWALLGVAPARAQSCPGHPEALGTSRTLVVSPVQYQHIGTMQYPQTLPLADHEVVITFDDGPLPPWSNRMLDILTAQCVKAIFFIVGKMARQYPEVVRREYEAGETIGTHSQDHPLNFQKLVGDQLSAQIDGGIASVSAALGDANDVAPFFRVPGLRRSAMTEDALAARGLVVFSSDVDADDWFRHIKPTQIVARAMSRLEKRRGGILLLHDIHPATVAALPLLLQALKDNGFRVVQVVPPAPAGSEMAGGPKAWSLAAASPQAGLVDKGAVSPAWPRPNANLATSAPALPAPDAVAFEPTTLLEAGVGLANGNAPTAGWPKPSSLPAGATDAQFPTPGLPDIGVSLRGETLISIDSEARASPPPTAGRQHLRHVRLRARHPVRARAGAAHRAGLPGLPSFARRSAAVQ